MPVRYAWLLCGYSYREREREGGGLLFKAVNCFKDVCAWRSGLMMLVGEDEVLGGKSALVVLCPPKILHGLVCDRTRICLAKGRRLTARGLALNLYRDMYIRNCIR